MTYVPRKRDAQRQKLYDWENTNVAGTNNAFLDRAGCIALAKKACARFGVDPPMFDFVKRGRCQALGSWAIQMPEWAQNVVCVLHETAHCIAVRYAAPGEPGHGPTFIGLFIELLARHTHGPHCTVAEMRRELRASARRDRLRVKPAAYCQPPSRELIERRSAIAVMNKLVGHGTTAKVACAFRVETARLLKAHQERQPTPRKMTPVVAAAARERLARGRATAESNRKKRLDK